MVSHGVTLYDVFTMVSQFRTQDTTTPIVLIGYLNLLESTDYERFVQLAGVDGVLMVDMPPEAAGNFPRLLSEHGLDMISLVTSTTSDNRLARISSVATEFLYYVPLKGKTGVDTLDTDAVAERVRRIRQFTKVPLVSVFVMLHPQPSVAFQTVWLWAAYWWPSWPDITATGRRSLIVGRYDSPDACDH